jgi:hypothetical protein
MDKPQVIAWMMGEEIAPDDPYRHIKQRALDLDAAAEIIGQVTREADCEQRAAAIGGVVEALAVESIDIGELLDASGLPEPGRDAACYLALSLKLAELGELDDDG